MVEFHNCIFKHVVELQKRSSERSRRYIVAEADEASVASCQVKKPATKIPRYSYTRIIAMLVRGTA